MDNLFQLPRTGDWIDLSLVTSIRFLPGFADASKPPSCDLPPRVRISHGPMPDYIEVPFNLDRDARKFRDELASLVNAAKKHSTPLGGLQRKTLAETEGR